MYQPKPRPAREDVKTSSVKPAILAFRDKKREVEKLNVSHKYLEAFLWPIFSLIMLAGYFKGTIVTEWTGIIIMMIVVLKAGISISAGYDISRRLKAEQEEAQLLQRSDFEFDWLALLDKYSAHFSAKEKEVFNGELRKYNSSVDILFGDIEKYRGRNPASYKNKQLTRFVLSLPKYDLIYKLLKLSVSQPADSGSQQSNSSETLKTTELNQSSIISNTGDTAPLPVLSQGTAGAGTTKEKYLYQK